MSTFNQNDSNSSNFIITELVNAATGTVTGFNPVTGFTVGAQVSQNQGVQFIWTAEGRSKPLDGWKISKTLRTNRTDYSDKPVEQILGVKFDDFTINGIWDNKYNGGSSQDFAWQTWLQIEALEARGNLCQFTFDSLSIIGVVKHVEINYMRNSYIGYSITVSPHYNAKDATPRKAPSQAPTPQQTDANLKALADQMVAKHQQSNISYNMVKGTITSIISLTNRAITNGVTKYDQVSQYVKLLQGNSSNISQIIENRLIANGPLSQGTNSLSNISQSNNTASVQRLVQEISNMRDNAYSLLSYLKSASAANDVTYQSAVNVLMYQDWARGLRQLSRQMIQTTQDAINTYSQYVTPEVIAIYITRENENLYALAQRFYGNTQAYRNIYLKNNLQSLRLLSGQMLVIPRLN